MALIGFKACIESLLWSQSLQLIHFTRNHGSDFPLPLLCRSLQEESKLHEKQSGHQRPALVWKESLDCCKTPAQPPASSITSRRIICENLKNLGGGTRPFLVVMSFSIVSFQH